MYRVKHINKIISVAIAMVVMAIFACTHVHTQGLEDLGFLANLNELKEISNVMNTVVSAYNGENPDVDRRKLMQGAIRGMVESLEDPHSTYFTAEEMTKFQEDIKGSYVGVGMVIQKAKNEPVTVVSPIEDSPAYRAGIKPHDKITEIGGKSVIGLTVEEASDLLKGKANTSVNVTVIRESTDETKQIKLVRGRVTLKYVKSRMIDGYIGYLRLTQFGENVYDDLAKDLEKLQKNGMKALVFDLRSNPGGSLEEAIKIASMFIANGDIVSTKEKDGTSMVSKREGKFFGNFPLAILINGGSASASEIVAGAVKDHRRGILIGEKTFGKGSVQTLVNLADGDGIKLTIAKYFTPSGESIHSVGINPDYYIKETDEEVVQDTLNIITNMEETSDTSKKHTDTQLEMAVQKMKEIVARREERQKANN